MKKIISIFLSVLIVTTFVACGSTQDTQETDVSIVDAESDEAESVDDVEADENIELVQYETNGYAYCVPSSWELSSSESSDDSYKFIIDGNENNIGLVKALEIPEVNKIDTGSGNAILTKEDVPQIFIIDAYEISNEEWKSDLGFDYYDAFFDLDDRVGRIIVIPINENEAGFAITVVAEEDEYLDDIDVCLASLEISAESENESVMSETETFYNLCMTLTKDDCTKDSLGLYHYNDFSFMSEDSDWMDSPLNDDGSINAGAFYNKLYNCIVNFEYLDTWGNWAEYVIGYRPESREEFEPYVEEYLTYMTDSWFGNSMVEKFQTMESVDVIQDEKNYTCTINNVTACADELYLSEEMLGYIMGALNDCGATITFDGSLCVVEYYDWSTSD